MDNKKSDKKINFNDLSKEELVNKCNTFLSIIQKAKLSKTVLQEEIDQLKTKLQSELKKQDTIPATEELIENLTQQKLDLVTLIDELKLKNDTLNSKLNQLKDEKKESQSHLNNLDNENVALKKQITRLSDENEQLMFHLDSLENQIQQLNKIGLDQQKQLLKLEENNVLSGSNTKESGKIQELKKMLQISLDEIKRLKDENGLSENRVNKEESSEINNKFKEKLKHYHLKIVKLAKNAQELKSDKEFILTDFKAYISKVNQWKNELSIVSNKLLLILNLLQTENGDLKKDNENLKKLNEQFIKQLEAHKTDDEKSRDLELKNLRLQNEIANISDIQCENFNLKKRIEDLIQQNALTKDKIQKEVLELKIENENILLEKEVLSKGLLEERKRTEENLSKSIEQIKEINQENDHFKTLVNDHNREKKRLTEEITRLKQIVNNQEQKITDFELTNSKLQSELEKSLMTEKQLAEKSSEEMLKLVKEIDILSKNSILLNEKVEEYEKKYQMKHCILVNADIQTENEYKIQPEMEEQINLLKSENSQLLSEMNEMNQELKERGENLSKLEAHCKEIKKKIKIYESQANTNVNNLTEKEEEIKELCSNISEKEQIILNLKNEMEVLKEKINSNFEIANSSEIDIMSTSTISRADEMDRLKDLEGSWEEKYGKLKNLAIKLKAKLREQINEVNNEKAAKAELHQKLNNAYENLKILQSQYDSTNDAMDELKKKCQEYSKKEIIFEESIKKKDLKIAELQNEICSFKQEKTITETWKKQISIKVQALRKELEEKEAANQTFEQKLSSLKSDLEVKDQALKSEIENHKRTKNSLQHYTNENKKHTVLNLEMQDYEKSVKELSIKLERKNDQLAKMKEQIDSQKKANSTLLEQNNNLLEKIECCETTLDKKVSEANAYLKKLSEIEDILKNKEEIIANLYQELEKTKSQTEELSSTLSSDIAERQKMINCLVEEKENLYIQNLEIQQSIRELQQNLFLKEEELSAVNKEFENYKIRAQSVLRQNQNRDIGLEEKLNGNVSSLLSRIQVLDSEINELRNSNERLDKLVETLTMENSSLLSTNKKINEDFVDLKDRFKKLQAKYDQTLIEHSDTVRSLKVHAETLGQCYRQQLSEQEVRHNREIIELQSKLEKSQIPTEIPLPSLPSMTREEGEGSESADSVNNLPVSLEKLLSEEDEHKVNILKKQISEQESKLHHLTELLADTEQDLAKHIQMNKVLKEEIRRQQRAVEREKHAENLEYLKNVVLKFITLQNGDERSRLVPVLNTILKLSPEETRQLDVLTKGEPGLRAWSSYLPVWTSSNKS